VATRKTEAADSHGSCIMGKSASEPAAGIRGRVRPRRKNGRHRGRRFGADLIPLWYAGAHRRFVPPKSNMRVRSLFVFKIHLLNM